jgi:hypothetical protein
MLTAVYPNIPSLGMGPKKRKAILKYSSSGIAFGYASPKSKARHSRAVLRLLELEITG